MVNALIIVLVALAAGLGIYVVRSHELQPGRVRVLIYHRLLKRGEPMRPRDREDRGCIAFDDEFGDQLRALKAAGYTAISPLQFQAFREDGATLPERSVIITFDDGWRSVYELAWPALRDEGMTATIFVNTVPDNPNFAAGAPVDESMTPEMIREVHAGGITIGSHGATHTYLTVCDDEQLRAELVDSRVALEAMIGAPVTTLAAPGGQSDERVARMAAEVGYTVFFGGGSGTIGAESDLMALPRLGVERETSGAQLVHHLTPWSILQHRLVRELKLMPTRLFGPVVSGRIRRALMRAGLGWMLSARFLKRAIPVVVLVIGAVIVLWIVRG